MQATMLQPVGGMDRIARAIYENAKAPLRLNTVKEREFCIPSTKSLSPSGAFLDPTPLF